jgi:hypothetical protein
LDAATAQTSVLVKRIDEGHRQSEPPRKTVRGVRPQLHVAEEVGTGLGRRPFLQRAM